MAADHGERRAPRWDPGWCAECLSPIVHDDVFGWLHEDAPDGQSFRHRAAPLLDTGEAVNG